MGKNKNQNLYCSRNEWFNEGDVRVGAELHLFDFDLKIFSKNNDFQYFHVGHLYISSLWTHIAYHMFYCL